MVDTQYICAGTDLCPCTGEQTSCDCVVDAVGNVCITCESEMTLIDVDNSDLIPPHRFEEAHDEPAPAPSCWECGQPRNHAIHRASAPSFVVACAQSAEQGTEESDG